MTTRTIDRNPIAMRDAAFAARWNSGLGSFAVAGLLEQPNTAH